MKKENERIKKIKELYNKYKEMKKDPRKKAGLKLLGYLIFFIVFAIFANIGNNFNQSNTQIKNTTTTTKIVDSYVEKQNDLLISKYNIEYEIIYNDIKYKISGTLENNIVNGYLENDNIIQKIKIRNNTMYEIKDNLEFIKEVEFDINNLNLNVIINMIKQNSAFIKEKEFNKTYLYELENKKIYVESNEEYIENIKIEENNNIYTLLFKK